MTTTELIALLKKYEFGASNRPRKISFSIGEEFIAEPNIKAIGWGDGIAGSQITLEIELNSDLKNNDKSSVKSSCISAEESEGE